MNEPLTDRLRQTGFQRVQIAEALIEPFRMEFSVPVDLPATLNFTQVQARIRLRSAARWA